MLNLPPFPPGLDWEVEIAANEAALKTKLNALRSAGTGVENIIFHPGVGFAVAYLRPSYNFTSVPLIDNSISSLITT